MTKVSQDQQSLSKVFHILSDTVHVAPAMLKALAIILPTIIKRSEVKKTWILEITKRSFSKVIINSDPQVS